MIATNSTLFWSGTHSSYWTRGDLTPTKLRWPSLLKDTPPSVPICLYRKPYICKVCPLKNHGRAGYIDDPLPNIVNNAIWMPACIVWLYYASSLTMWWFLDLFFLLSVWSPFYTLSRKKKDFNYWDSGSGWDRNFYMGMQNGSNHEL